MKEIYVKEMPKTCVNCKYFAEHRRQCNLELCLQWNEVKFKFDDCPLIDIKDHDKELVAKVLRKAKSLITKYDLLKDYNSCAGYFMLDKIIEQIQKEFKDE